MPLLQLFGDSYASGFAGSGIDIKAFGAVIAADLVHDFDNKAIPGTGYLNNAGGNTFLAQANAFARADATTTMVSGTLNDQTLPPSTVQSNAAATYTRIKTVAPATTLIVVGPSWPNASIPADLLGIRDVVRTAALAAGAIWIDPLADGWFNGRPELIGPDGFHPTDAGHAHMRRRISIALGLPQR